MPSRKYTWFTVVFALSLALDQGSKAWARSALRPIYPDAKTVIAGFFDLRYSENSGSAFGFLGGVSGARYILFFAGVIALGAILVTLKRAAPAASRLGVELGLLAGGAIGNLVDRALVGRVTDFIVWKYGVHEWPTFNIADAALVLGLLGLLLDLNGANPRAKATTDQQKAA